VFHEVRKLYPDLDMSRTIHESVRRLIGAMVQDLLRVTQSRIDAASPATAADIRALNEPVAQFSENMRANDKALKSFLFENMYRHYKLNRMTSKGRRVVKDLFQLLLAEPECLPTEWRVQAGKPGSRETAELVCDYIADMTDRLALDEHRRLFDLQSRTS
jgi:dGTPase